MCISQKNQQFFLNTLKWALQFTSEHWFFLLQGWEKRPERSAADEETLWLALRGDDRWESWETEAGEMCRWAHRVETANSCAPGVSLGLCTCPHIQVLAVHTKQLSRCHKHYNQLSKDSPSYSSSSSFFLQCLPPFLPFCRPCSPSFVPRLQQTTHHIHTVHSDTTTRSVYTIRAGCWDLKSTVYQDKLSCLHW